MLGTVFKYASENVVLTTGFPIPETAKISVKCAPLPVTAADGIGSIFNNLSLKGNHQHVSF